MFLLSSNCIFNLTFKSVSHFKYSWVQGLYSWDRWGIGNVCWYIQHLFYFSWFWSWVRGVHEALCVLLKKSDKSPLRISIGGVPFLKVDHFSLLFGLPIVQYKWNELYIFFANSALLITSFPSITILLLTIILFHHHHSQNHGFHHQIPIFAIIITTPSSSPSPYHHHLPT